MTLFILGTTILSIGILGRALYLRQRTFALDRAEKLVAQCVEQWRKDQEAVS